MIQALRGMKDIMHKESELYTYVVENCQRIAKNYGFEFIQTPILEETALFKRSVGESSDIVGKEMYQFTDKGGHDVCMRPEGTAGVVRAFVEKKLDRTLGVYRYFYHGPMFRYERPQKGRFRQFHQFGVESFGLKNVEEDATIILMLRDILEFFGLQTTLKLNSLGCETCMTPYRKELIKFLNQTDGLCEDCERRKLTNPIRTLDCKNKSCQALLKDAPRIVNNLCASCEEDFIKLKEMLDMCGLVYEIDSSLVRGLDYYNKTAFEFVSDDLGAQSSIVGGGRYDKLVEFLDGKPTCGIGFAIGIERLMDLVKLPEINRTGYYMGGLSKEGKEGVFLLASQKRKEEKIYLDYEIRSLKAHLKQADKKGALWCVCMGENELKSKSVWLKNLHTKEEKNIPLEEF